MEQNKDNKSNVVTSDIDKLKLFFKKGKEHRTISEITHFSDIDGIYRWTNEYMNLYPKESLEGKSVLTVTSSADHALEAILCGATNIDSIDINIFCKYYSALKIAMIKKYDYSKFFHNIMLFTSEYFISEKKEILEQISMYLTPSEIEFLNTYINRGAFSSIFCGTTDGSRNIYYCEKKYNELKDRLDDININYYDSDLVNIDKVIPDKKYDCMYLSNVLERVLGCYGSEKLNKKNTDELLQTLIKHLNDYGLMYNYFLGLESVDLDEIFKIYAPKYMDMFNCNYYYDEYNYRKFGGKDAGLITMKKK